MKMKLNLKDVKFKELVIEHVEKGVLVIGGVLLLMFLMSAAGREKLPPEREPDKLRETTTQIKNHVEQSKFDPKLVEEAPPDYANRVRREPVLLATYSTPVPFDGPIVDAKVLRDEPPVLTIRDLRVNTGFAPFALESPEMVEARGPARRRRPNVEEEPIEEVRTVDRVLSRGMVKVPKGAKLVVKYWAMITGLIPIREQKQQFFKAFEMAAGFNQEADLPNYLGYHIERAEVTSGNREDLKWTRVSPDKDFMLQWAVEVPEPVQPDCVTAKFVAALGPRVGSIWEDYVAHLPEVKFEERHGPGTGTTPGGRLPGDGITGGGGAGSGGPRGGGGFGESDVDEDEAADTFETSRVHRPTVTKEDNPEEHRRQTEVLGVVSDKQIKGVDHLLFRFCDFTVVPGKTYVYRVRIGLSNPNKDILVKYLRKPELRDSKSLISDWSKPSPPATIPFGDKLLAGPVTPPTLVKEPVGRIRIVQVKESIGAEVPLETDVFRGSLANFAGVKTEYVNPNNEVREVTDNFVTNAMVLDLRGGKPLLSKHKDLTEPGEMLVLSREGKLLAMHEFEDENVWFNYAVPEEKPPAGSADEGLLDTERKPRPGTRPVPSGPRTGRSLRGSGSGPANSSNDPLLGGEAPVGGGRGRPPRGTN